MPYDLSTAPEHSFRLLLVGGLFAAIALGIQLTVGGGGGAMSVVGATYAIALMLMKRSDEYLQSLLGLGARWGMGLVCLWLGCVSTMMIFGGELLLTPDAHERANFFIPPLLANPVNALLAAVSAFYSGAVFKHLRA